MVGPAGPEMGGDLLRAPLEIELGLHLGFELGVRGQLGASGTSGSFAAAVVGQVGVVSAVVVRAAVAPQLPTHRRWRPPEQAGYLPDGQTAATQRGDPSALQQRQVPARRRGFRKVVGLQATILRPPSVARLAPDAELPARLDAAHPSRQEAPVLGLEFQSALASPPRHQHSTNDQGMLRQALEPKRRNRLTFQASPTPGLATDTKPASRHGRHTPRTGNPSRRPGLRSLKLPTSLNTSEPPRVRWRLNSM